MPTVVYARTSATTASTRIDSAAELGIELTALAGREEGDNEPGASLMAQGTLERIADRGEFRIGYDPDARPLSFLEEGDPAGYLADELFSYESYALILRRNDADFRLVANRVIGRCTAGQFAQLFQEWIGSMGVRRHRS
jgi:ABC-type amino acid transport substrate-binding protein